MFSFSLAPDQSMILFVAAPLLCALHRDLFLIRKIVVRHELAAVMLLCQLPRSDP